MATTSGRKERYSELAWLVPVAAEEPEEDVCPQTANVRREKRRRYTKKRRLDFTVKHPLYEVSISL